MSKLTVRIQAKDEEGAYCLGVMSPPSDHTFDTEQEVECAIYKLWEKWQKEWVKHPSSYYEFITWLVDNHGWTEQNDFYTVTVKE